MYIALDLTIVYYVKVPFKLIIFYILERVKRKRQERKKVGLSHVCPARGTNPHSGENDRMVNNVNERDPLNQISRIMRTQIFAYTKTKRRAAVQ